MPPLSTWYSPKTAVLDWAREYALNAQWKWKAKVTRANGQPALGFYAWDDAAGAYLPFALNVLSLRDGLVSDVTAFIVRAIEAEEPEAYVRFPEQPMHRDLGDMFDRFALPSRLN
jgi:hypothetical protein